MSPAGWTRARPPARRRTLPAGAAGSILLEVVLAAVLVGLIVGTLATAFAGMVEQARAVRQQPGAESGVSVAGGSEAWEWGPRVIAAWWRPGPALHVRISGTPDGGGGTMCVGLWADGWPVDEMAVPGDDAGGASNAGELQVGAPTWTDLSGQELVIRVRAADGAWGPPWRLAVAVPSGADPAPGSPLGSPPSGPTVVAHRPGMGTSTLQPSWSPGALTSAPFGLVFAPDPAVSGWGGATLDGRSQWWWMEEGRSVDLYF